METVPNTNWLAVPLGAVTLAAIRLSKRFIPKFPMAVVMILAGAAATALFHIEKFKQSREKLEKRLKKQNPEGTKKIEAWESALDHEND